MKRKVAVGGCLVALLVLTGAVAAWAGGSLRHSTTGADFGNKKSDGYWTWCSNDGSGNFCKNGGFRHYGTITDTNSSDGDNVYSKVKVEGYNPASYYGTQNGQKYQNIETYDYQAILTKNATYWVCRDRSAPYSDNCSTGQSFSR
ncbi:MAG: hypothetical protein M3323_13985 [Actinomycetota bacterium]|nr:hypothetical protein [Actinomycetota bacterium]